MKIFLDMDGVLADFDTSAARALGCENIYKYEFVYGGEQFWRTIHEHDPDFFLNLDMMPDARQLMNYAMTRFYCSVLTAIPKKNSVNAGLQKRGWISNHFGDIDVITCRSSEKPDYCTPGDILIDDRAINKDKWEKAGGHFIIHTSAAASIAQLQTIERLIG